MARKRMSIRVIKEILRLRFSRNLSIRLISQSVNRSSTAVHNMVRKAEKANLCWPVPEDIDDDKLERMLYAKPGDTSKRKAVPDWASINHELEQLGTTRQLLWGKYASNHPDNHYSYSRFCSLYSIWRRKNTRRRRGRNIKPRRNALPISRRHS